MNIKEFDRMMKELKQLNKTLRRVESKLTPQSIKKELELYKKERIRFLNSFKKTTLKFIKRKNREIAKLKKK